MKDDTLAVMKKSNFFLMNGKNRIKTKFWKLHSKTVFRSVEGRNFQQFP